MQGSIKGKTQWLYADPKQKRDLLLRSRAKAHELYTLLLDTEAKEGVLAANAASFNILNTSSSSASAARRGGASSATFTDPSVLALLQCVGTSTNLHKLFLSAQRWMYSADVVYQQLLRRSDMYATVSSGHRRWVSAGVFPHGAVEGLALDPNASVSVLMDRSANATGTQIPSPWLYVQRESTGASKCAATMDGTQGQYNTDRMNDAAEGRRAQLPEDSLLTRRLSKDQQLDFMQNLPYRMCATDDTGETTLGRYQKRPRRRGTSEQRANNTNSQRIEGLPLARDGSVTSAACAVCVDPRRMTPYECLHAIGSTVAYVINSLYFEGRAASVSTTSREVATFLETVFGEFLDEQFLSVELVERYDAVMGGGGGGGVTTPSPDIDAERSALEAEWLGGTPLAAASVWAVPDGGASTASQREWSSAVCEAMLLRAAATDCRSIIVPAEWRGAAELQKAADSLRSRVAAAASSSSSSALSAAFLRPTIPTIFSSQQPVHELLSESTRVPYLTLLSPDTALATRVAMGSSLGTPFGGGSGGSSNSGGSGDLHESVRVVGVNAVAVDTPLFFPGAACPLVGRGWRSTAQHEPTAVVGNSHRFESVGRSLVAKPWDSALHGVKRFAASYDAANTTLASVEPPGAAGLVSERLCAALAGGFSASTTAALLSAKVLRF